MPSAPPLYSVVPFVAMLLAIALGPLALPRWWEAHRHKLTVSVALGLPVLGFYLVRQPSVLAATAEDYVSFIVLLAGLYVISGGILLRGDLEATPVTNTAFLALGAALASCIGTTGASLLLIRPLLQTNRERQRVTHTVIFFIFLVSNIGGLLTPLGDPPLFLGYLLGVPFSWTFRLWPPWTMMVGTLLVVYFCWDSVQHARETTGALRRDRQQIEPLHVRGISNVVLLAGVDERGHRDAPPNSGRDQRGIGGHGRQQLHRQCPQFHGQGDRGGGRHSHAKLRGLHGLQCGHPDPALRCPDLPVVLVDQGEHLLGGHGHRLVHHRELVRLESRQDVVRHVGLVIGTADADLHAADVFGADGLDDRAHAVVATVAALHAHANGAQWQIDVVVDEDEVGGIRRMTAQGPSHDRAGHVHEGLGLDEFHRLASPRARAEQRRIVTLPAAVEGR